MKSKIIQVTPVETSQEVIITDGDRKASVIELKTDNASDLFEPLTKLLKVCGLYYSGSSNNGRKIPTGHLIYCIIVQLIVVSLPFRYLTIFQRETNHSYKKIGLIGLTYYYFTWTAFSLMLFYSNWKFLPQFYSCFDKYSEMYGLVCNITKTKTIVKRIVVVFSTLLGVTIIAFTPLLYFYMKDRNLTSIANFTPFDEGEGALVFTGAVFVGFLSGVYYFILFASNVFFMLSLHIITHEFKQIANITKDCIVKKSYEELEKMRLKHQDLTNVLERGNALFRHLAGFSYAYGIPMVCLLLYGVTTSSLDLVDIAGMASMMSTAFLGILIITFKGAFLNDAAHEPLPQLYTIPFKGESQETVSQIQQYISQLISQKIGVSVYGLFVIDHSTTLMVFGTIISYAVIVVQFTVTPISQTICNCTNV